MEQGSLYPLLYLVYLLMNLSSQQTKYSKTIQKMVQGLIIATNRKLSELKEDSK